MDIEALYAAIVDGSGDGGDLSWTRRRLQHLALERAKTTDVEARLGALRVGALLGSKDGLAISHELVTDADTRVRTIAFNQVVASRDAGLAGIRKTAGGSDPELASAAFDLLIQWVDVQSMQLARRSLLAPDARIRQRAATLLGHVAGPGVILDLQSLASGDPDEAVRQAASEAIRRISGELPKGVRQPWWDEPQDPVTTSLPPQPEPAQPEPAQPEPAQPELPVPVAQPGEPRAGELQPGDGTWARLPSPLPTETRALIRLLGMVAPEDRAAVIEAVDKAPARQWSELALGWSPGADPAISRGLAWSASGLGRQGAVSKLVTMLGEADPSVRIAAAEAIGELGGIAMIPSLTRQFVDPDPQAAAAAVRALVSLAIRVGRPDLARDQLARVGASVPQAVSDAVAEARSRLGK
jgi:hypothetical protein